MKKNLILLFFTFYTTVNAQQSINASGVDASGINGKISYSIGQIDYLNISEANGSVSQGVQHYFEVLTLGIDDYPFIQLEASIYPNPTVSNINLIIRNYDFTNLEFKLIDILGKTLVQEKIIDAETSISMENYSSNNYFIAITENGKTIKTFKIIKK